MNCFGRSPPSRVPFPAATTMATFMRLRFGVVDARPSGRRTYFTQRPARPLSIAGRFAVFGQSPEDHLAGGRLQDAGHGDVGILANQAPRVINDHHGSVIE